MKVEAGQRQAGARCASAGALLTGAGGPPAEAGAGERETRQGRAKEPAVPATGIHKCVPRASETAALQYWGGSGGKEHSFPNAEHSL